MKKSIFGLVALAVPFAAHANLVQNGGFENLGSGVLNGSGWNYFSSIPNWVPIPANNVLEVGRESVYGVDFLPGSTNLVMELDTRVNTSARQTLSGLQAGKGYFVTFSYARRNNTSLATNGVRLTLSGTSFDFFPTSTTAVTVTKYVLATSDQNLTFTALGNSDSLGTLIDNVSVTAVPGPAAAVSLLAGMAAGFRRRRRAKKA